jgi:hypothetical protein
LLSDCHQLSVISEDEPWITALPDRDGLDGVPAG